MHTVYNNTHNTCKNESKHSEMGPVRQNPIQRPVRSVHNVCASHCALHIILHRTNLIIFPLTLQTITTALMMSIWGKGGVATSCATSRLLGALVCMLAAPHRDAAAAGNGWPGIHHFRDCKAVVSC